MAKIEIILPAMGEGIIDATITKWLVKEGDFIKEDESIVEVATDKVDSEIPSPSSGKIVKLLFKEGDVPTVGSVLAIIENQEEKDTFAEILPKNEPIKKVEEKTSIVNVEEPVISTPNLQYVSPITNTTTSNGRFLSPLVRNIAGQENIPFKEIEQIEGTGLNGRITKEDVLSYLNKTPTQSLHNERNIETPHAIKPVVSSSAGDEIIVMDRIRKLIADHMVNSKHVSAHVTSFIEADVTNMVNWREGVKDNFLEKEKEKLTFTPIIIEAVTKALKDFSMINVSVDGDKIIIRKNINIGMATALPTGNLIVPVIKNADEKNLLGLVKAVNDLAARARGNKLKPDEIQGGTFSITNFGTFNSLSGTPIINQPETAILGIGAIKKRPAVIETPQGDAIAIRHIMILSLSYDHRVIDGALGGMFLQRVVEYLEKFNTSRNI